MKTLIMTTQLLLLLPSEINSSTNAFTAVQVTTPERKSIFLCTQEKMSALHAAAWQSDLRVLSMLLTRVDRMGQVDVVDKVRQNDIVILCRCSG